MAVTDASVEQKTRAAAISWIIANKPESFGDYGDTGCPTFLNALDSYGSESFALLVVLSVIKVVCNFYNIKRGHLEVACDSVSSLAKSIQSEYRAKVGDNFFDLLWSFYDIQSSLDFKFVPIKVAGHQELKKKLTSMNVLLFFAIFGAKPFGAISNLPLFNIVPFILILHK